MREAIASHDVCCPLDFIARLASLVPKPRVNLTRFHGVFAPNSQHRALVTPAKRGKGNKAKVSDEPPTPGKHRASMIWAHRLKRVFNIDIETCRECGGAVRIVACIEDPVVIQKILDHLRRRPNPTRSPRYPRAGRHRAVNKRHCSTDVKNQRMDSRNYAAQRGGKPSCPTHRTGRTKATARVDFRGSPRDAGRFRGGKQADRAAWPPGDGANHRS